jgi:hypothetical protein
MYCEVKSGRVGFHSGDHLRREGCGSAGSPSVCWRRPAAVLECRHRDAPFVLDLPELRVSVDYEPAESTTGLFGGNSNWRGPAWFPVNYLLIDAIGRFFGDDFVVGHPTGCGVKRTRAEVAADHIPPRHRGRAGHLPSDRLDRLGGRLPAAPP